MTERRPTGTPAATAMARKGAAKSQRQRWSEKRLDVHVIRFVHAEPGESASIERTRFVDQRGRRVEQVTVRIAGPLTVNGCAFPYAAAFEAVAAPRYGTGKLVTTIIPHASEAYGNRVIKAELCRAKAEHVWQLAKDRMGQGPGDGSHKPQRRRSRG